MDAILIAEVCKLAAMANLTQAKVQQGKYWEGELHQDLCEISNLAKSLVDKTRRSNG